MCINVIVFFGSLGNGLAPLYNLKIYLQADIFNALKD